jgi:hypothetical protein
MAVMEAVLPDGRSQNGAAGLDRDRVTPAQAAVPDGDPVASAEAAGLRYVTDAQPGIRRERAGRHFTECPLR